MTLKEKFLAGHAFLYRTYTYKCVQTSPGSFAIMQLDRYNEKDWGYHSSVEYTSENSFTGVTVFYDQIARATLQFDELVFLEEEGGEAV